LITNPGPELYDQPLVVLLEVFGSYFWHPSWTSEFEYEPMDVGIGEFEETILSFFWPDIEGSSNGLRFYGALLNDDFSAILGAYDMVEFGWGTSG